MLEVTLDQARIRLPDLVRAAIRGEVVRITTDTQQTVQLVPTERAARRRVFGSAQGLIAMTDDFDAPLADFGDYTA